MESLIRQLEESRANFPILFAHLDERDQSYLAEAIADFAAGLRDSAIANKTYADAKQTIGNRVYKAYESSVQDPFFKAGRYERVAKAVRDFDMTISTPHGLHEAKSFCKKVAAFYESRPELAENRVLRSMHAFATEIRPLVQANEALKPMVFKRQPKSAEQRLAEARYVPPMADEQAEAKLRAALESVTRKHYHALVTMQADWYRARLAALAEKTATNSEMELDELRRISPTVAQVVHMVVRKPSRLLLDLVYHTDAIARIQRVAELDAQQLVDEFVRKNLLKLASIIDRKGNMVAVDVQASTSSLANLQGTLQVRFSDGASFVCENSAIVNYSVNHVAYRQFPLKFREAVQCDGKRVKRLSEKWMNEEFM